FRAESFKSSKPKSFNFQSTNTRAGAADILRGALANERRNPQFADLTVAVGKVEFQCHRLVLAATSGFFRSLLSSRMKEPRERKVELHDISFDAFTDIMTWIYDGDLVLSVDTASELVPAADQLDIEALKTECADFLENNLTADNCIMLYNTGSVYNCQDLKTKSWEFLLSNFDAACLSGAIFESNAEDLKRLVADPNLVTRSEDMVVEYILRWVRHGEILEDMTTANEHHMSTERSNEESCLRTNSAENESVQPDEEDKEENQKKKASVLEDEIRATDFDKERHSQGISTSPQTEAKSNTDGMTLKKKCSTRSESLADILGATKYLLVSSNCLWSTLANDPLVQADRNCRAILDKILQHKTQLDGHQNEWKLNAAYRNPLKLKDVLLVVSSNCLYCKLRWDEPWKQVDGNINLPHATKLAYYEGNIYIRYLNKELNVFMPRHNTSYSILDAKVKNTLTVAMFPVGNELFSVYRFDSETYAVESFCLSIRGQTDWNQVGHLSIRGMEVAGVTNICSTLVVFWKKAGQSFLSIECFDLNHGESILLPDQLSSSTDLVTFKHGQEAFALLQNGVLWRISAKNESPYITLKLELWLWNFHRAVSGAMLVNGDLWVIDALTQTNQTSHTQPEDVSPSLDGVFHRVRFSGSLSHQTNFVHAELPNSIISSN
ncbi:hypothetical protein RRG08_023692, partial [Elysia crispata]